MPLNQTLHPGSRPNLRCAVGAERAVYRRRDRAQTHMLGDPSAKICTHSESAEAARNLIACMAAGALVPVLIVWGIPVVCRMIQLGGSVAQGVLQ